MILVVRDVEPDQFMTLVVLPLIEGKDQTAELLLGIAHLEVLLTAEL